MPLYAIRRHVGPVTQDELDASAFRAIICGFQFEGLKWHRSFWNRQSGDITCIYEAMTPAQLQDHARVSRIPCDEVAEVSEVVPGTYIHG